MKSFPILTFVQNSAKETNYIRRIENGEEPLSGKVRLSCTNKENCIKKGTTAEMPQLFFHAPCKKFVMSKDFWSLCDGQ